MGQRIEGVATHGMHNTNMAQSLVDIKTMKTIKTMKIKPKLVRSQLALDRPGKRPNLVSGPPRARTLSCLAYPTPHPM